MVAYFPMAVGSWTEAEVGTVGNVAEAVVGNVGNGVEAVVDNVGNGAEVGNMAEVEVGNAAEAFDFFDESMQLPHYQDIVQLLVQLLYQIAMPILGILLCLSLCKDYRVSCNSLMLCILAFLSWAI